MHFCYQSKGLVWRFDPTCGIFLGFDFNGLECVIEFLLYM